jgi:hypothetical protein
VGPGGGGQARQLPHALRTVIANLNAGRKTYVYGTRSQQRVAYILVMYFCWFEKLNMDEAMAEVARLRPASKANVDLWLTVHGKLALDETHGQRQARLYTQVRHHLSDTAPRHLHPVPVLNASGQRAARVSMHAHPHPHCE